MNAISTDEIASYVNQQFLNGGYKQGSQAEMDASGHSTSNTLYCGIKDTDTRQDTIDNVKDGLKQYDWVDHKYDINFYEADYDHMFVTAQYLKLTDTVDWGDGPKPIKNYYSKSTVDRYNYSSYIAVNRYLY